jgi:hypothetical protein
VKEGGKERIEPGGGSPRGGVEEARIRFIGAAIDPVGNILLAS